MTHTAENLRIGGLVPFSAIDFPGRLAAVVFCQGCSWRCGYCHNPHLLPGRGEREIPWSEIAGFLDRRRGLLDAVVFSGGEPTRQPALLQAIREVKALGFAAGLHTAGMYPRRLAAALPLLDWVGMDVKAPFTVYDRVTGVARSAAPALASARLLAKSGCAHEFRTTVDLALDASHLTQIADELEAIGARRYALQECRPHGRGAADHALRAPPACLDPQLMARIAARFEAFEVRRA